MIELEQFARRHAELSTTLNNLYSQLGDDQPGDRFSAAITELNERICELQRDVLRRVLNQ